MMNSNEKKTQGHGASFSAKYRADWEQILPDPAFVQQLEATLTAAAHSESRKDSFEGSALSIGKRRRRWIAAAACFVLVFGAAGVFVRFLFQQKGDLLANQIANDSPASTEYVLSSSETADAADFLESSEENTEFDASSQMKDALQGSQYSSAESAEGFNSSNGAGNPVTGGDNPSADGSGEEDQKNGGNSLQVVLQNAVIQEEQNLLEEPYLELLYSNCAERSVLIDASYTVQQMNEEGQYVTLPLTTLQTSPTEFLHLSPGESGVQVVQLQWYAENTYGSLEPGWYRMIKTVEDTTLSIEFFLESTVN